MENNTNIVSLLTQSFSRPAGGNPATLTDSSGRAEFDQVLGREFERPAFEKESRDFSNDRIPVRETAHNDRTHVREKAHNDTVATPARSDRPQEVHPDQAPPVADTPPAGHSEKPVAHESGNQQTAESKPAAPAVEPQQAEPSQVPADATPNTLSASQQALKERLEQLNIDPGLIDTLLASLVGNPQANGLLQSLYGLLTATGASQQGAGALATAGETQAGLPKNMVLQNLMKLGLSEADARQVIEQASLAVKQTDSKSGPLLATLPQVDGLKGNAAETSAEKVSSKPITQNLPLTQNNAETNSNTKNSSGGNGDKFEKLASLLRSDTNPSIQTTPAFKLAASPMANLNGPTTAPLNVPDGLALQTVTAVDNAGKAAQVFKPVLAETYGQRGAVDKTIASQIIERISFRGMGSHKEINIKLDPPALGSVRMTVSTSGESVRTTIVTESHFVKQVIESQLPQLRDSLANQGIKVDQFSVLVGGNSQQNTAHQQESANPTPYLGLDNEDLQDTLEDGVLLARGPVIFNDSTISVFA